MTDTPAEAPHSNTWEAIIDNLRRRYPGQKDSVLFCIYKLQQNPQLTLRDFRAEADLHGIPTAGRALHSARGLLGLLEKPMAPITQPSEAQPRESRRRRERPDGAGDDGSSIESKVVAAVRQIQSAAGQEAEQLRAAIRQAIALLQRALAD